MAGVSAPAYLFGKGKSVSTFLHQHWMLISLLALGLMSSLALLVWSLCAIGQGADYAEQRLREEKLEKLLRRIA
jgi:hypothetical protein